MSATFGEKLRKLRKDRGWSQDRLGESISIHGRHVGKYESGETMPNSETVIRIAGIFDVSIDYLLLDEVDAAGSLQNKELLKKFHAIEQLPDDELAVVNSLLDAYIKKHQIESVMAT